MTNPEEASPRRSRVRVWLAPAIVVSLLMALLATMYLAYVVDPSKHLHGFPIALVDQDSGDVIGGKPTNVGKQISDALVQQTPSDKIDLRGLGINEAQQQLNSGNVYGAIVIPSDFTKRLGISPPPAWCPAMSLSRSSPSIPIRGPGHSRRRSCR
ncbi:YhgE/Pip domain-containing protein [Nocardia sp. NPDC050630]|uniref:YhgE/Pip domain-containing protein n=1 Tax=Nocardia sp. NPDC050630 TaxID=3364321 RepID=UPI0037891FE1